MTQVRVSSNEHFAQLTHTSVRYKLCESRADSTETKSRTLSSRPTNRYSTEGRRISIYLSVPNVRYRGTAVSIFTGQ